MPQLELKHDGADPYRILTVMYMGAEPEPTVRKEIELELAALAAPVADFEVPETDERKLSDRGWRGTVSGSLLAYLVVMADRGVRDPSVSKAIQMLHRHAIDLASDGEGKLSDAPEDAAIPQSANSMRNFWRDYRSVAHLWAAHLFLEQEVAFFRMDIALKDADVMRRFLGHAAWFLDFLLSYKSRNTKANSQITRARAWMIVPSPAPEKPNLDWLNERVSSALTGYRAVRWKPEK